MKVLLASLALFTPLFLFAGLAGASSTLSVVQTTTYSSGSSTSATATLAFTTPPATGDLLLVGLSFSGNKVPSAASSGWTQLDDNGTGTTAHGSVYDHVVVSGESNSYVFTTTGGDFFSAVGFDISGQSTTAPIDAHEINVATNVASLATTNVSPTANGDLPVTFYMLNDGSAATSAVPTVSIGWTNAANPQPMYHEMSGGYRASLTSGTTAISNTWTWDGTSTTDSVVSMVLVAPAASVSPSGITQRDVDLVAFILALIFGIWFAYQFRFRGVDA